MNMCFQHEACHHGHVSIAEMLLEKGALVDVPGTDNDTPLHDAICQGKTACVSLLKVLQGTIRENYR